MRLAYWASFGEYLKGKGSGFSIRRPIKDNWCTFGIGRAGFHINATISTEKSRVGVELWIVRDIRKLAFGALYDQKTAIEQEFGEALYWQELPGKKGARIAIYKSGVDPSEASQYHGLHEWMLDKLDRFKNVFAARVRALQTDRNPGIEEGEDQPEE